MLVNKKRKMIFVRIPKAASTSINNALIQSDKNWRHIHTYIGGNDLWHMSSRILKDFDEFSDYKLIAVSRNPWDRLVSLFCFYLKRTSDIIQDQESLKLENHEKPWAYEWAKNLNIEIITKGFHNFLKNTKDTSLNSYSFWVDEHHPGGVKWLHYEQLGDLEEYLNIKLTIENKSSHLHYSSYYDDKTKEFVGERYIEDIIKFNYKFEEP